MFSDPLDQNIAISTFKVINILLTKTQITENHVYRKCVDYLNSNLQNIHIYELRLTQPNVYSGNDESDEFSLLSAVQLDQLCVAFEVGGTNRSIDRVNRTILSPDVTHVQYQLEKSGKSKHTKSSSTLSIRYVEDDLLCVCDPSLFYQSNIFASIIIHGEDVGDYYSLKRIFCENKERIRNRYGIHIHHMLCRSDKGFGIFSPKYIIPLNPWLVYNELESNYLLAADHEEHSNHILVNFLVDDTVVLYSDCRRLLYYLKELVLHGVACVIRQLVSNLENESDFHGYIHMDYDDNAALQKHKYFRKHKLYHFKGRLHKMRGDIHMMLNNKEQAISSYELSENYAKIVGDTLCQAASFFCMAIALSEPHKGSNRFESTNSRIIPRKSNSHTLGCGRPYASPRSDSLSGAEYCDDDKHNDLPKKELQKNQSLVKHECDCVYKGADCIRNCIVLSNNVFSIDNDLTDDYEFFGDPEPKKLALQPMGYCAEQWLDQSTSHTMSCFRRALDLWMKVDKNRGKEFEILIIVFLNWMIERELKIQLHSVISSIIEFSKDNLMPKEQCNILFYVISLLPRGPFKRKLGFYTYLYENRRLYCINVTKPECYGHILRIYGMGDVANVLNDSFSQGRVQEIKFEVCKDDIESIFCSICNFIRSNVRNLDESAMSHTNGHMYDVAVDKPSTNIYHGDRGWYLIKKAWLDIFMEKCGKLRMYNTRIMLAFFKFNLVVDRVIALGGNGENFTDILDDAIEELKFCFSDISNGVSDGALYLTHVIIKTPIHIHSRVLGSKTDDGFDEFMDSLSPDIKSLICIHLLKSTRMLYFGGFSGIHTRPIPLLKDMDVVNRIATNADDDIIESENGAFNGVRVLTNHSEVDLSAISVKPPRKFVFKLNKMTNYKASYKCNFRGYRADRPFEIVDNNSASLASDVADGLWEVDTIGTNVSSGPIDATAYRNCITNDLGVKHRCLIRNRKTFDDFRCRIVNWKPRYKIHHLLGSTGGTEAVHPEPKTNIDIPSDTYQSKYVECTNENQNAYFGNSILCKREKFREHCKIYRVDIGNVFEIEVTLCNPLPIPISVENLSLITLGSKIEISKANVVMPASVSAHKENLSVTATEPGICYIIGLRFSIFTFFSCDQLLLCGSKQTFGSIADALNGYDTDTFPSKILEPLRNGSCTIIQAHKPAVEPSVNFHMTNFNSIRSLYLNNMVDVYGTYFRRKSETNISELYKREEKFWNNLKKADTQGICPNIPKTRSKHGRQDSFVPRIHNFKTPSIINRMANKYEFWNGIKIPLLWDVTSSRVIKRCPFDSCRMCIITNVCVDELLVKKDPTFDRLVEGERRLLYVSLFNNTGNFTFSDIKLSIKPIIKEAVTRCLYDLRTKVDRELEMRTKKVQLQMKEIHLARCLSIISNRAVIRDFVCSTQDKTFKRQFSGPNNGILSSKPKIGAQPYARTHTKKDRCPSLPTVLEPGKVMYVPITYRATTSSRKFQLFVDYTVGCDNEFSEGGYTSQAPKHYRIYKDLSFKVDRGIRVGDKGLELCPKVGFDHELLLNMNISSMYHKRATLEFLKSAKNIFDHRDVKIFINILNKTKMSFICKSNCDVQRAFISTSGSNLGWNLNAKRIKYMKAKYMNPSAFLKFFDSTLGLNWSTFPNKLGEIHIDDLECAKNCENDSNLESANVNTKVSKRSSKLSVKFYRALISSMYSKALIWKMRDFGGTMLLKSHKLDIPMVISSNLHNLVESKISLRLSVTDPNRDNCELLDEEPSSAMEPKSLKKRYIHVSKGGLFKLNVYARNNSDNVVQDYSVVITPFLYGSYTEPKGLFWTGSLEQIGTNELPPRLDYSRSVRLDLGSSEIKGRSGSTASSGRCIPRDEKYFKMAVSDPKSVKGTDLGNSECPFYYRGSYVPCAQVSFVAHRPCVYGINAAIVVNSENSVYWHNDPVCILVED